MKHTDTEDEFMFTTRGCLTGNLAERKKEADRIMEIMNDFFNRHRRMPNAKECDQIFRKDDDPGDLTYELDGDQPC
jgi:hypothetical protein